MFLSEKIMGQTVVSYTLTEVTAFFQQNCLSVVSMVAIIMARINVT